MYIGFFYLFTRLPLKVFRPFIKLLIRNRSDFTTFSLAVLACHVVIILILLYGRLGKVG